MELYNDNIPISENEKVGELIKTDIGKVIDEKIITKEIDKTDKTDKDINSNCSKKITFKSVCYDLQEKFTFGKIYLFLDIDFNKYCVINYNSLDKFDNIKYYDKQSLKHLILSMLKTRINNNEIEKVELNKDNIGKLLNSVQGVKKSFNRLHKDFYIDSDYLPTLNMFKKTNLLKHTQKETFEISDLINLLNTKYKRLNILLKNNIGNEKCIEWFLNWVSLEINNPTETKTSFVIIGEQGSGKSLLVEEIFKENIYHFSNVSVLDNKTIKDNFNDIYNYKSFIIMNEISTMDLKENNQITQDLKRLISDGSYINRGMFKSGVEKQKTFNICFTTNKNTPIQIENGDRRFSVFGRGTKLLDLKTINDLLKENNENFDCFIKNVKKEIKDFLYFVKYLNYDLNVSIQPIMTELKQNIIEHSNKKEDLFVSSFNIKDYENIEKILKSFEYENEDEFFFRFKHMWNVGIFDNETLFEIYVNIYDIEISSFNEKMYSKKSGVFWGKILKKPVKPQLKLNGKPINVKVFDFDNLEIKKDKLREIINGTYKTEIELEIIELDIDNELMRQDMIKNGFDPDNLENPNDIF